MAAVHGRLVLYPAQGEYAYVGEAGQLPLVLTSKFLEAESQTLDLMGIQVRVCMAMCMCSRELQVLACMCSGRECKCECA